MVAVALSDASVVAVEPGDEVKDEDDVDPPPSLVAGVPESHPATARRKTLTMGHFRIRRFDKPQARHSKATILESSDSVWSIPPMTRAISRLCMAVMLLGACGETDVDASGDTDGTRPGDGEPCAPMDDSEETPACADGRVCEVSGDGHICAAPIEIRGIVFDAVDGSALEGAHITALDTTGSPVGSVSRSDADGRYTLVVRSARDEDGSPAGANTWTLFVVADDYQAFPGGLRPALPIDADDATKIEGTESDGSARWVLENPSTDVGLLQLPEDQRGGRTVSGVVEGDSPGGTLVVAEGERSPARYAVADSTGAYTVFDVPAGPHTMVGYRGGLDVLPATIDGDADIDDADLVAGEPATATVRGTVNIVNAPGGRSTSVVLVPASTYNDNLERGPVPPGLRAPRAPQAPSIDGEFEIDGVPPGRYTVLAALENDTLVRDPDTTIAGTDTVEIEITDAGVDLSDSFKVTEGLAVISPGAETPEHVSGSPTFVFADDSSEDRYEVVVFDALGERVWDDLQVPGVSGSDVVEVPYGGPPLTPGQYYQFRATSIRETPNSITPISRTEDLRGVFIAG